MTLFSICDRGTEDEALPPEVCDMAPSVSMGSRGCKYRAQRGGSWKKKRKREEGRVEFRDDYAFLM